MIGKNKYCTVYSIFKEEKKFTEGSRIGEAVRKSANASNRSGDLYIYCVSVLCLSLIHIYYIFCICVFPYLQVFQFEIDIRWPGSRYRCINTELYSVQ